MNRVELIGRTTKDIELNTASNGVQYTNFSVATRREYGDKDGNDITDFHNCAAFGELAELISKYVKKGDKIFVAGELIYDDYTNEKGEKKHITKITISKIEFLESKKDTAAPKQQPNQDLTPIDDDSLPF